MENLHLLFNKSLYNYQDEKIVSKSLEDGLNRLVNTQFFEGDYSESSVATQTFKLKTRYPGLLAGIGYAHGISDDNDVKVGFSFDYVTGQPYIPGSTIKGVIRNVFDKPEIIKEILNDNGISLPENEEEKIIKEITEDIFENNDVFFDAVVCRGTYQGTLNDGKIMGFDSITPHPDPVKNPVPIKILKVLSDVIFEFRFILQDTKLTVDDKEIKITAGKKKWIFKEILTEFGIGAKTNVGYGVLANVENEDIKYPLFKSESENKIFKSSNYQNKDNSNTKEYNKQPFNNIKGKNCPHCGKWNNRYKKDSDKEYYTWRKNECFSCQQSLELK